MTDDREPFREARAAGLQKRHEQRLENATYTAAEVKVLTETATKLGYELGRAEMLELLADFVDDDECWFDHHGSCQAHGWFRTDPACPHARAKTLLRKGDPA